MVTFVNTIQPITATTIHFSDTTQNLLATDNDAPQFLDFEIFGFDYSFNKHFSESTFGVSIPLVYFGFDVSAHAAASLTASVLVRPGTLGINYDVDVNDIRAANGFQADIGNGNVIAVFQNTAPTWDTAFDFNNGLLTANATNTAISSGLYLDFDFGFAIKNVEVGIDLYFDEFGVGPFDLIDVGFRSSDVPGNVNGRVPLIESPQNYESGPVTGSISAVDLPSNFVQTQSSDALPSLTLTGDSLPFAQLAIDVAQFISSAFGATVEISGDDLYFKYTVLSVKVGSELKVGQVITFTPSGVQVDLTTSLAAVDGVTPIVDGFVGEHLTGMLGDTFTFDTPASGAGVLNVEAQYTLHGTLTSEAEFLATAGVTITALSFELHNRILKDFDIGVGPLVTVKIPENGIPLGGVDAYSASLPIAIASSVQNFQIYFEQPLQSSEGDDELPLSPLTNLPGGDSEFDVVDGMGGNDTITGNLYDNLLRGGGGNDFIYGNEGDDELRGNQGTDRIYGDDGNDLIFAGGGDDTVFGGEGNDAIFGGEFLNGGGSDTLHGEGGDDVLNSTGLDGADFLDGGLGTDTAVINRFSSFVGEAIDFRTSFSLLIGQRLSDGTSLSSIEILNFKGGAGSDAIVVIGDRHTIETGRGNDFVNILNDKTGTDTTINSHSNVYVNGGAGDDQVQITWNSGGTYYGDVGDDRLIINTVTNTPLLIDFKQAFVDGTLAGGTVIGSFETVTFNGGNGDDDISGTDSNDILNGGGGDDILTSNLGADRLNGGAGNDVLTSNDALLPAVYQLQPNGILRLITPKSDDVLDGGDGYDIAVIDRSINSGSLTFGTDNVATVSDGSRLLNIEALIYLGGGGSDEVRGGVNGDNIAGDGGNDTLDGGGGQDIVDGGAGDDLLIARAGEMAFDQYKGGDGIDDLEVDFSAVATPLTLDLSTAGVSVTLPGVIRFDGFERYQITGTAGNDSLIGGDAAADPGAANPEGGADVAVAYADRLLGGAGNDILDGRGGRDVLSGGDGDDTIIIRGDADLIDGSKGVDTLEFVLTAGVAYDIRMIQPAAGVEFLSPSQIKVSDVASNILGATVVNVERLVITGLDTTMRVDGGTGNDVIGGSTSDDILNGQAGDDEMNGRGGVDHLDGGDGIDTLVFAGTGTSQTINFGLGSTRYDLLNGGSIKGFENILFNGGAGNEIISVKGGQNALDGNGGSNDYIEIDMSAARDSVNGFLQSGGIFWVNGGDYGVTSARTFETIRVLGGSGDDSINARTSGGVLSEDLMLLYGNAGNDILSGGKRDDFIDGGEGADTVRFSGSRAQYTISYIGADIYVSDNIAGRDGTDRVVNAEFFQFSDGIVDTRLGVTIIGSATADILSPSSTLPGQPLPTTVNDYIYGNAGDDRLDGGLGADKMYGGLGNDLFIVEDSGDVVIEYAGEGSDTVRASINYQLGTNVEMLVLIGNGNINGTGHAGNNTLWGNDANNVLDGRAGADEMRGFIGDDTYFVDDAGDTVIEDPAAGYDTAISLLANYTLTPNVEELRFLNVIGATGTGNGESNVIAGTNGNDTLSGLGGADELIGGAGNDSLDGGTGIDTLYGGMGNDSFFVDHAADLVSDESDEGYDTLTSSATSYTIDPVANVEHLITTGAAQTLVGNAFTVTMTGSAIRNILVGGDGNNQINAGSGDDTVNAGAGDDTIAGDDGNDSLNGEDGNDVIRGGAGVDTIDGGLGRDLISGGDGNDTLRGGTGAANELGGGAGDDTYFAESSGDSIIESANEGYDSVQTTLTSFTLAANVESLFHSAATGFVGIGNAGSNQISGNVGSDTLKGLAGDDTLSGGSGAANTLIGGTGNDTYDVSAAGDSIIELAGEGTDSVNTTRSVFTLSANVENLSQVAGVAFAGVGNGLANVITGNFLADTLIGLGGNDRLVGGFGTANTLLGGTGDDVYVAETSGDTMIELLGQGIDTVESRINSMTLAANIENLTYIAPTPLPGVPIGPDPSFVGRGNGLDNVITGGTGLDTLIGLGGNDTLIGGTGLANQLIGGDGNDIYVSSAAGDSIIELANQGTDTVQTSRASITLSANVENLVNTANGTFVGIGNALDNVMTGNSGRDTLVGGAGDDVLLGGTGAANELIGGIGSDIYRVSAQGDSVVELAGEGEFDTVVVIGSLTSYTLPSNVEILDFSLATGSATGSGNGLNNQIYGGSAGDHLFGMGGDDIIDGGEGLDTLTGGAGADSFLLSNLGGAVDVITDFLSGTDTIQIFSQILFPTPIIGLVSGVGGLVATSANSTFFYQQDTGVVSFDVDGTGAELAIQICNIGINQALSAGDFLFG